MKYRKRPVDGSTVVEAFQWHGEPVEGFERIVVGYDVLGACRYNLVVPTPIGVAYAVNGDWITRGFDDDLQICKANVFHAAYEKLAESPHHS